MKLRFLVAVSAIAAVLGVAAIANASTTPPLSSTERRTQAFFTALTNQDIAALTALLHPDVTWSVPMALSGDNDTGATTYTTRDQLVAHFEWIATQLRTVRFTDQQISVTTDGRTSFTQAKGDFVTATGAPYRNVYVFRLDWRGDRVVAGVEYANPATICASFGLPGCP